MRLIASTLVMIFLFFFDGWHRWILAPRRFPLFQKKRRIFKFRHFSQNKLHSTQVFTSCDTLPRSINHCQLPHLCGSTVEVSHHCLCIVKNSSWSLRRKTRPALKEQARAIAFALDNDLFESAPLLHCSDHLSTSHILCLQSSSPRTTFSPYQNNNTTSVKHLQDGY